MDWNENVLASRAAVWALLRRTKRVAVLGVRPERMAFKPAHYLPAALQAMGLEIVPVPVVDRDVDTISVAPIGHPQRRRRRAARAGRHLGGARPLPDGGLPPLPGVGLSGLCHVPVGLAAPRSGEERDTRCRRSAWLSRRRGAGCAWRAVAERRAGAWRRSHRAVERGCAPARPSAVGILHSSKMGYPLYRRLGFQDYCRIAIYLWPGEASAADNAVPA
jgi:hypothetical protein